LKYIRSLLTLLFVITILSFSLFSCQEKQPDIESQLTETTTDLLELNKQIEFVRQKLLTMEIEGRVKESLSNEMLHIIESVVDDLSVITILLDYEAQFIMTMPHITDKYKPRFANLRAMKISAATEQIKTCQKYLSWIYGGSPYKSTLRSVGNPTVNIQTSLELLEKAHALLVLKSAKQTQK